MDFEDSMEEFFVVLESLRGLWELKRSLEEFGGVWSSFEEF